MHQGVQTNSQFAYYYYHYYYKSVKRKCSSAYYYYYCKHARPQEKHEDQNNKLAIRMAVKNTTVNRN